MIKGDKTEILDKRKISMTNQQIFIYSTLRQAQCRLASSKSKRRRWVIPAMPVSQAGCPESDAA